MTCRITYQESTLTPRTVSFDDPLRGRKGGMFEGGVRAFALARGWGVAPALVAAGRTRALVHAVDWFGTVVRVASNASHAAARCAARDCVDVWDALRAPDENARLEIARARRSGVAPGW